VLGLKTSYVAEVVTSLPSIQSGRGSFVELIFAVVEMFRWCSKVCLTDWSRWIGLQLSSGLLVQLTWFA
jgi:hypothetical protein